MDTTTDTEPVATSVESPPVDPGKQKRLEALARGRAKAAEKRKAAKEEKERLKREQIDAKLNPKKLEPEASDGEEEEEVIYYTPPPQKTKESKGKKLDDIHTMMSRLLQIKEQKGLGKQVKVEKPTKAPKDPHHPAEYHKNKINSIPFSSDMLRG